MLIIRIIDNAKKVTNILSANNANSTISAIQLATMKKITGDFIKEYKIFLDLRNVTTDLVYVKLSNLWELLNAGNGITGSKTSMITDLVGALEYDVFSELYNYYYNHDMEIGEEPSDNVKKFIDYMLIKLTTNGFSIKEGLA